jgi:hypothetical protein
MGQLKSVYAYAVLTLGGCGEHTEIVARERSASLGGADNTGGSENSGSGGQDSGGSGATGSVSAPRFGPPSRISELNDPNAKDQDPTLTEDQLEIFFFSDRGGNADIWRSTREDIAAPWEPPVEVAELNSDSIEQNPTISRDGLRIWFYSRREPLGLYYSERPSRADPFVAPEALTINAPGSDGFPIAPALDARELRMAISIGEGDTRDLYEQVRPSLAGTWGEAVRLSGINSDRADSTPFLVDEGHEILFHSGRSGQGDLYWAYREAPGLAFTHVEPLDDVNDPMAFDSHPHLTTDRKWLYFGSDRGGVTDLHVAEALGN